MLDLAQLVKVLAELVEADIHEVMMALDQELEMEVHLVWTLVDIDNPTKVLARGKSIGETRFFLDANTQAARQTALIDALKRASEAVVTRLADGF